MATKFDHVRMSPDELSEALRNAGLSPAKFRRLTGVSFSALRYWLAPESDAKDAAPPFWVTTWLAMYAASGDAQQEAERVTKADLIRDTAHAV